MKLTHERILLIGDRDRQMRGVLSQAMPGAQIASVGGYFDAIAELTANSYTSVLAATEPIERRPEAAMKTLRQLLGDGRLLLFGHPTLEPLSRKMLDFGADDYVVTPADADELREMFGTPPARGARPGDGEAGDADGEPIVTAAPSKLSLLGGVPLAEIAVDALLGHPHDAPGAAVRQIDARISPTMRLAYVPRESAPPAAPEGLTVLTHAVRSGEEAKADLHLTLPEEEAGSGARHFLAQLAQLIGKLGALQERHARLQKLAITDDLTGVYNGRYFKHFLSRIIEKARAMRFPVTLLLFDIDNFKSYNDRYGHGVGDEILKQTAALMRRCCRDHDLVARISGDEFAVVFWEKGGPRQPREPGQPAGPSRPPQTPVQILDRFRRLLSTQDFRGLGPRGKGTLTISGGLAVFPYDAQDMEELIAEADRRLMFGAKTSGKNTIYLVGGEEEKGEGNDE